MSLKSPEILRLSQDCLNCIFDLLSAYELTLLYFSGDKTFQIRMFSRGAITTLRVSNNIRERNLLRRYKKFPSQRGEIKCQDGLNLPIVFQLPFITTYIERRILTSRNWPEHASHPYCLLALPPTLTHLESDWSILVRRLHQHDLYQPPNFDVLKDPYTEDGILSVRKLFPQLRTLIIEDKSTRLAHERYREYTRPLISAFKAANALSRWELPDTLAMYPPNLTVLHIPLRLLLDAPILPSIPPHLTSLKLLFEPLSPSPLAGAPAPYFLRAQDPTDGELTPEVSSDQAKTARILEKYQQTFAGVVSLHTWHANPKVLSIFSQLTELHTTSIRDVITARYLPKTLTTFSTGFNPQHSSPSPPIVTVGNFDTYGWLPIVENLPRGITRLALHNVVLNQAMLFSSYRQTTGDVNASNESPEDDETLLSRPNPFPPKLRSLSIIFTISNAPRTLIKELGYCSLAKLLPTMQTLEEVHLERTHFRYLGRFPNLSRLSLLWCSGEAFTEEHWKLFPKVTVLEVFKMRDSALLSNRNEISTNIASVYATELSSTGSLLRRHSHPITSMTPGSLLKDLKLVQTPFSLSWHDFCVRPIRYLPPALNGSLKPSMRISLDMLLPLIDPSSDDNALAKVPLPPNLHTLSLQYECEYYHQEYFSDLLLRIMGWKSMQRHGTSNSHLPIHLGSLLRLPSSITMVHSGKLFFDIDTLLEVITRNMDAKRPLNLGKSAIMAGIARISRVKFKLDLHTNRPINDRDLKFFPRGTEVLSIDSQYASVTCKALFNHFHHLTSLKFDDSYIGELESLVHMTTLTHITYRLNSTSKKLGLHLLPPSITSLELLGKHWVADAESGIKNSDGIPNVPVLPWPEALRSLCARGNFSSIVYTLPKDRPDFQELTLTDWVSISFGNDLVKFLPPTLTSLNISSYGLSARAIPHLPRSLTKLKVLGGALDCREALEYLAERRSMVAEERKSSSSRN